MSAPSPVDEVAAHLDPDATTGADGGTGQQPPARAGRERRSLTAVDRLSRDLGNVCTTAVDPMEIAALVEAQGITDATARDYYRCDDVFDLAERLWDRTPAVAQPPPPHDDANRRGSVRDLLHGVLFALNGLFFSVGLQTATDRKIIAMLVLALVVSWVVGQITALLWYRVEDRAGDVAGRAVLRRSLQVVLLAGIAGGLVAERIGLPPPVTLMAVAQVYLVVAASALLLYRKEGWFFVSLTPALAALVAGWAMPGLVGHEDLLAIVVVSVLAIVVEAIWLVRPAGRVPRHAGIQPDDIGAAAQMAAYGMTWAVLLSHTALSTLVTGISRQAGGFDVSVLPLVLTIGVAEWQLRSYRHLSRQVLALTDDLVRFGTVAWHFLLSSLARYAGALVAVSVVLWVIVRLRVGAVPTETTLIAAALAVLGGAMFCNLVLVAHARVDLALRSMVGAGALYLTSLAVQRSLRVDAETLAATYLALCGALFLTSLLATRAVVRQALAHL